MSKSGNPRKSRSPRKSPAPNQPPNRGSSIFLLLGIGLLLATSILGVYAIVTKQETVTAVISFGLALLTTLIGILRIAPNIIPWLQQTGKTRLFRVGISLLFVSLIISIYLLIRFQAPNSQKVAQLPTQTSVVQQPSTSTSVANTPTVYVTPYGSPPAYAHVSIALHSYSPSAPNQETIVLDFKNTGTSDCTHIKIYEVNLFPPNGNPIKLSSPSTSFTLPASRATPVQRNVTFPIALVKGEQYNLYIHMDIGGCALPHDYSNNRIAHYQLPFIG